jgi:hypothetical protein
MHESDDTFTRTPAQSMSQISMKFCQYVALSEL